VKRLNPWRKAFYKLFISLFLIMFFNNQALALEPYSSMYSPRLGDVAREHRMPNDFIDFLYGMFVFLTIVSFVFGADSLIALSKIAEREVQRIRELKEIKEGDVSE
jgi:polyferredoxin